VPRSEALTRAGPESTRVQEAEHFGVGRHVAHTGKLGEGPVGAPYCPIVVDYFTDEVVPADLLNDSRLVVHFLPMLTVRDYVLTTNSGSQFTTGKRENYSY
jgi:hypothetical protein